MMRAALAAALILSLRCASAPAGSPPPAVSDAGELGGIQTSLTEMLERLDVLNDRIARLEQAREESAAAQPPPRAAQRAPAAVPLSTSAALRGAQLAEQYRSAIMMYGARRVEEARTAFRQVFDADPASELADNALFWIGETYYSDGDWPNAISFYRRVSTEYGDQNKAPDAVYKLAMSYARSGDLALARSTFQEVIARYPYSTPAASARRELERIKY